MDNKVSSKKIANNILEFLVDPSAFPLERRLYFHPEEILMNESFEKAKRESEQAYGDQRHNSDFYPNRPLLKREATSSMERKTLIASLDVLSQDFIESDPMATDLRTMAYAVANMTDEEFEKRLAGNPWIEHMNKVRKDNPGKSFKEIASLAKKTFKKAEEEKPETKEASEKEFEITDDSWSKEASDAVQKALIAEIAGDKVAEKRGPGGHKPDRTGPHGRGFGPGQGKGDGSGLEEEETEKEAGKIKGPGKPDGTGPLGDTPECQMAEKEEKEEKEEKVKPKKKAEEEPKKEVAEEPEKKEVAEEPKEATEEPTEVETDVLEASHTEFGGIQLGAGMVTMDDIGDLSEEEQQRLGQLFK